MKARYFDKSGSRLKPVAGGLLALSLAFGLAFGDRAMAAISQDESLAKLEVKFFKHTYPKDADETRLDRLEKMIFGETRSGADTERLKNLAATVPNLNDLPASSEPATADAATTSEPDSKVSNRSSSRSGRGSSTSPSSSSSSTASSSAADESMAADKVLAGESKYPAVTALEQHLFKRDYANEAVGDRLNRLESKVFGRPSKFTDLSERVDALKEKTNVDVAKRPPGGTDWTADDDDGSGQSFPEPRRSEPVARTDGDDGRSFSGRDVGSDLRKAFGIGAAGNSAPSSRGGSASGAYGMGGTTAGSGRFGNGASGAYGMNGATASTPSRSVKSAADLIGAQLDAEEKRNKSMKSATPAAGSQGLDDDQLPAANPLGLNQQVSRLETVVLGKNYSQDPLIDRVGRLEKSVFPKEADAGSSLAMPERVARLIKKVPAASENMVTSAGSRGGSRSSRSSGSFGSSGSGGSSGGSRKHSGWIDEDADLGYRGTGSGGASTGGGLDDSYAGGGGVPDVIGIGGGMGSSMSSSMGSGLGGMSGGMGSAGGMSGGQVQQPKGLGKIINSMGRALSGGGYTGGYNVNSGNLRTDPSTGYLIDSMTGNLINPTTGAVMGTATTTNMGGAPIYSGTQLGGMPVGVGIGGLGGIGGIGGLGGIGGIGGLGGIGGGIPMGGIGYGGLPYGSAYGGMPFNSYYGSYPGLRPYGGGYNGAYGSPYGYNGFNNGFGPYTGGVGPGAPRTGIGGIRF
jgi:hypothetical protein